MDINAFAQTTQSQVYIFNATGLDLYVTVNNYPRIPLRGYGTSSDSKYSPFGAAVPHVKDNLAGGFVDGMNVVVFSNPSGISFISNSFSLPDPSVKNNLIMYMSFNNLFILDVDGFILQKITVTQQ